AAATRHRIPVSNTPDVLSDATAESAFFMMGAVARKTYASEELVRKGKWGVWHPHHPWLGDKVTGKTVAAIGPGPIGKSFIQKCVGFDMNVLVFSRRRDDAFAASVQSVMDLRARLGFSKTRRISYVTLEEALSGADFVALHVPLIKSGRDATLHLMN